MARVAVHSLAFMFMPEKRPWIQRAAAMMQSIMGVGRQPIPGGISAVAGLDNSVSGVTQDIYRALIPTFLYKPAFGFPLGKDVPELRRMGKTAFVFMVKTTITDEIAELEWKIKAKDGLESEVPPDIIEKTTNFFFNPNINEESTKQIIRKLLTDILEIDAGVLVKVRNLKDELIGMLVYDGGTFTKNPDIHGIMPEEQAYWQYGWSTGARPIPFNRNEIVYMMRNPRPNGIYGESPVEILYEILRLLAYGVDSNLEYFTSNNIAKGVFSMDNADAPSIKSFKESWADVMKKKDEAGNWRKDFYKMPIINTKGEFIRTGFSNVELELIEQQKWFTKLVWACFGITPSELGFTEDSNRATEVVQSNVFKRKAIKPLVDLIEYHFNTQIVNDLPWIKGKYENKVIFEFDKTDIAEEYANRKIQWQDIRMGLKTINEVRKELHMPAIKGGDELRPYSANPFGDVFGNGKQSDSDNATADDLDSGNQEEKSIEPEDLKYGDVPDSEFNAEQLAIGIKIEMEHTTDSEIAKAIAKAHLSEFPAYYSALVKMEESLSKKGSEVKKKIQQKELTASSRLAPKNFEEMGHPKHLELEMKKQLELMREAINRLIIREAGQKTLEQIKAIDQQFVNRLVGLVSFSNLRTFVEQVIRNAFSQGLEEVENETNRNFLPNQRAIDFLQNYTFSNIQDMETEARNDLRAELQRGIMNGESVSQLAARVDKIIDDNKTRAEMIARTESNRAANFGSLDAYKQSGLEGKKEWIAEIDEKTSEVCRALNGKTVGLNEKFVFQGKEFDAPPAHPNCRSTIAFVPE